VCFILYISNGHWLWCCWCYMSCNLVLNEWQVWIFTTQIWICYICICFKAMSLFQAIYIILVPAFGFHCLSNLFFNLFFDKTNKLIYSNSLCHVSI
jgi:hypothetical protein